MGMCQSVVLQCKSVQRAECTGPPSADGHAEKQVRGALKANVERAVSKRTTVLLDSLNSIKGYRSGLASSTACSPTST